MTGKGGKLVRAWVLVRDISLLTTGSASGAARRGWVPEMLGREEELAGFGCGPPGSTGLKSAQGLSSLWGGSHVRHMTPRKLQWPSSVCGFHDIFHVMKEELQNGKLARNVGHKAGSWS